MASIEKLEILPFFSSFTVLPLRNLACVRFLIVFKCWVCCSKRSAVENFSFEDTLLSMIAIGDANDDDGDEESDDVGDVDNGELNETTWFNNKLVALVAFIDFEIVLFVVDFVFIGVFIGDRRIFVEWFEWSLRFVTLIGELHGLGVHGGDVHDVVICWPFVVVVELAIAVVCIVIFIFFQMFFILIKLTPKTKT